MRYKVKVLPWDEATKVCGNPLSVRGINRYSWINLWKPNKYYEVEYAIIVDGKVLYSVSTDQGEYFTVNLPRDVLIMSQHDSVCILKNTIMHRQNLKF